MTLKDPTNYRWEDGTIDTTVKFNITQATPVVTKPTTKTLTYNGSEQELVNAASTNGGTVKYSIDNKKLVNINSNRESCQRIYSLLQSRRK